MLCQWDTQQNGTRWLRSQQLGNKTHGDLFNHTPEAILCVGPANERASESDMDSLLYNQIQDVIYLICIPILCVLGCVGNIVNLVVLTKGQGRLRGPDGARHSGTHSGLILLSVSDLALCLVVFPRALTNITGTMAVFDHRSFGLFYQAYGTGVITTLILTSTWITVAMAALRYLAVCQAATALNLLYNVKFVRLVYGGTVLGSVALNLPSFWQFRILYTDLGDKPVYLLDLGAFAITTKQGWAFLWSKTVIGIVIPAIILALSNCFLAITIRRSFRLRATQALPHSANSKNFIQYTDRTTRMLIVIVLLFIFLVFPCEIMDFFHDVIKMDPAKTEIFLVARSFANLLQVLNFSGNFFVYCLLNGHFRAVAKGLVTCRRNTPQVMLVKRMRRANKTTMNRHIMTATNMELQAHKVEYNNHVCHIH